MSSDSEWSDWSGINYIDWEDLKVREEIGNEDNDTASESNTCETSTWESDDDRWDLDLKSIQTHLRNVRHEQLAAVLEDSSWANTEHMEIDIQRVNSIIKEPLFPSSPSSNESEYEHNIQVDNISNDDPLQQQHPTEKMVNEDDSNMSEVNNSDTLSDKDPEENIKVSSQYIPPVDVVDSSSHSEYQSSSDEFVPSKNDINDSDSDSDPLSVMSCSDEVDVIQSRQIKKIGTRKTKPTPKKISKSIQVKKRDISDILLARAKKQSATEEKRRRENRLMHSKRLDVILKSNGLKRDHVPAHGNCFFEAVAKQAGEDISPNDLREQLCNHLQENSNYYKNFLGNQDIDDEINILRQSGQWTSTLSDFTPLAIANILSLNVKIYSSDIDQPVITVTPTLVETKEKQELQLAYLCVPGNEHYDSVATRTSQVSSGSDIDICIHHTPNKEDSANNNNQDSEDTDNVLDATPKTPKKQNQQHSCKPKNITPRKQAKYNSPKKKFLARKKKAQPNKWKKTTRKQLRQSGKSYISVKGKEVGAKSIVDHSCAKCRFKCGENITEDDRLDLFNSYWNLQSYERQRDFICAHVLVRNSIGSPTKKRKQFARKFTFHVNGQIIKVCKDFFIKTLGIGRKTIETALKKSTNSGTPVMDRRGKHQPHNKTPEMDLDNVRKHIESFSTVESHYTRKDTDRKYLSCDITIRKMHDLYKNECMEKNKKIVSEKVYRRVFCEEYNISFHKPKKDQCITCNQYTQAEEDGNLNDSMKSSFQEHQRRKERAREEKQEDKEKSRKTKTFHSVTFDLEAVLSTPCSLVSQATKLLQPFHIFTW